MIELKYGVDGKQYKLYDGTWFHKDTPDEVCRILSVARDNKQRLVMELGDRETSKEWGDSQVGYIGRSTGSIKIPLAVFSKRSMSGPGLLENCIVRIREAKGKRVLWSAL